MIAPSAAGRQGRQGVSLTTGPPRRAIAEPKQWRPLQRYIGCRDHFEDTVLAVAITGLVSDRAAER
ncbi:hypothetical protein ABZ671_32310 [Micromonospora sp. NPDC006766]|uniref:hypothetical protein n=1 Tax=Micromonospora sp. NPDC006766 TaxID=3154778 RepID=UPI0033E24A36